LRGQEEKSFDKPSYAGKKNDGGGEKSKKMEGKKGSRKRAENGQGLFRHRPAGKYKRSKVWGGGGPEKKKTSNTKNRDATWVTTLHQRSTETTGCKRGGGKRKIIVKAGGAVANHERIAEISLDCKEKGDRRREGRSICQKNIVSRGEA